MTEVVDYEYEEVVVEETEHEYEEVEVTEEGEDHEVIQETVLILEDEEEAPVDYGYGDGDGGAVDYGYGDVEDGGAAAMDYGYGDDAVTDYGYGDDTAPTPAPAPVPETTTKRKPGRRASLGAGTPDKTSQQQQAQASSSQPGKKTGPKTRRRSSMGATPANLDPDLKPVAPPAAPPPSTPKSNKSSKKSKKQSSGMGGLASFVQHDSGHGSSPKEKRRQKGRRLSMFAFAGQEEDQVGQYAGQPAGGGGASDTDTSSKKSSSANKPGVAHDAALQYGSLPLDDNDMLASFIKGQGMPGGGIVGSNPKKSNNNNNSRRLSMMAFAGNEVLNEEQEEQAGLHLDPTSGGVGPMMMKSTSTTQPLRSGSRRAKPQSQQQPAAASSRRGGMTRSNSSDNLVPPVGQPAPGLLPRRTGRRASIGGANPAVSHEKAFGPTASSPPTHQKETTTTTTKSPKKSSTSKSSKGTASSSSPTKSVGTKSKATKQQLPQAPTLMNSKTNNRALSASMHIDERSSLRKSVNSTSTGNLQVGGATSSHHSNATAPKGDSLAAASDHVRGSGRIMGQQQQQQQQQQRSFRGGRGPAQSLSQSMHGTASSRGGGASTTMNRSIASGSSARTGPTLASSSASNSQQQQQQSHGSPKKPTSILRASTHGTGKGGGSSLAQQAIPEQQLPVNSNGGEVDVSALGDEELQQYMESGGTATDSQQLPSSSRRSKAPTPMSLSSGASSTGSSVHSSQASASSAKESAAAAMAAGVPSTNNMSLLYFLARCCDWEGVLDEVQVNPRDAKVVSEKDGTTALHLAVMSRTNPMMRDGKAGEPAPLPIIEALVQACPEAAITRCAKKRYTPLHYACLVADANYDMEDCCHIVEVLLKYCPFAPFVFTDDGFSALDVHILSYSQLHKHKQEVMSGARTSTVVVRTLLAGEPSLADARVYRNKIRGPLELLYRCNIDEFKEAVEYEELAALEALGGEEGEAARKRREQIEQSGSVALVLSDWWAWKWALLLLKFASISAGQEVVPFNAVQAAARLVGCPLPILALAVTTFPQQVMERDPTGDIYNLPLHEVCSWRADMENVAGDPFIATRKFKAMRLLLDQFPEAARMTNNCGETPLQLAVETCTPWHGGLETLVEACPKALKFPRKLRITDNGLSLAVSNHCAIDSIATVDSEEPDPLENMESMYPFLVSAVLGGVSKNKRRPPVSYSDEMASEHDQNLERKSLQAVRAVFGLLRARPEVLDKYRKLVTAEDGKRG